MAPSSIDGDGPVSRAEHNELVLRLLAVEQRVAQLEASSGIAGPASNEGAFPSVEIRAQSARAGTSAEGKAPLQRSHLNTLRPSSLPPTSQPPSSFSDRRAVSDPTSSLNAPNSGSGSSEPNRKRPAETVPVRTSAFKRAKLDAAHVQLGATSRYDPSEDSVVVHLGDGTGPSRLDDTKPPEENGHAMMWRQVGQVKVPCLFNAPPDGTGLRLFSLPTSLYAALRARTSAVLVLYGVRQGRSAGSLETLAARVPRVNVDIRQIIHNNGPYKTIVFQDALPKLVFPYGPLKFRPEGERERFPLLVLDLRGNRVATEAEVGDLLCLIEDMKNRSEIFKTTIVRVNSRTGAALDRYEEFGILLDAGSFLTIEIDKDDAGEDKGDDGDTSGSTFGYGTGHHVSGADLEPAEGEDKGDKAEGGNVSIHESEADADTSYHGNEEDCR